MPCCLLVASSVRNFCCKLGGKVARNHYSVQKAQNHDLLYLMDLGIKCLYYTEHTILPLGGSVASLECDSKPLASGVGQRNAQRWP